MPNYRTVAQAQAEYDAVRAAYLNAVDKASYSISSEGGSRSKTNQSLQVLRDQMLELEQEIGRLTDGGIPIKGATPVDG